jgi:hypothetical protein
MSEILVGTSMGCRRFIDTEEVAIELSGRSVGPLIAEQTGSCLAIVDGTSIWRRGTEGLWSSIVTTSFQLQSIASTGDIIFAGGAGTDVLRIDAASNVTRLSGFDSVSGRLEWFANGPPLGVRSITVTAGGRAVLAAVHVGGIPRSFDDGETWTPTIPVMFDVHEVRAHSHLPGIVVAATAIGLCVSINDFTAWQIIANDIEKMTCLACAVLEDKVLFSVQDGPFAERSQIWKWQIGSDHVERVLEGLPEWLDGKVDTGFLTAGNDRAALVDAGGNLWLSESGSTNWRHISSSLPSALGLAII